jgi:hypothetical protein
MISMNQQLVIFALLLLLLLGVVAPFSALAGLMLIAVGALLYGLLIALVRAFINPEVTIDPAKPSSNQD